MITGKFTGLPDLKAALAGIAPKLRVRALRNALAAGARVVQKAARAGAPVINPGAVPVRKGYRKPGTVQKAISVRTSKLARRTGDVGVFVNVRPAKAGNRGAKSALDPFYWRWQEFGARAKPGAGFLRAAGLRLGDALRAIVQRLGPAIDKFNHGGRA